MTKDGKPCAKWIVWVIIAVVLACVLALAGIYLAGRYALRSQRAVQAPPAVLVRQPAAGARFDPHTPVEVVAEAWGSSPMADISLYFDGRLLETRSNAGLETPSFRASFQIEVNAGPHVIVARAVDQQGRVGQSLPINIFGNADDGSGPALMGWPALAGETLADIARKLGFGPHGLDGVNPTLGDGGLAAGTIVQVPVNPGASVPQVDIIMPEPIPVDTASATNLEVMTDADIIRLLLSAREILLPEAPSGTQAAFRDCSVILRWDDNSEGEAYFNIWMSGLGHSPRIIARASSSPGKGPVWVQFDAPEIGIYSFWVEAVNLIGSQPSEVAWVGIVHTEPCANVLGTYLQIDLRDLSVQGGYDRFYCYVSANGFPARRFPPQDGIFIQMAGPPFNLMIGGDITIRVPIPEPRVLTLEGECLGWLGGDLVNLGPFQEAVPESEWDGRELTIDGGTYQIEFTALIPHPTQVSSMVQSQYDITLATPYDLRLDSFQLFGGEVQHALSWRWDGDPDAITGFSVFIDGIGLGFTENMSLPVLIPEGCGISLGFTVSALGRHAPSLPSQEYTYSSLPCEVNAVVEFISLNIYGEVDDESDCFLGIFPAENCYAYGRTCDGYDAVGWISAEGLTYQKVEIGYWQGNVDLVWPVNCYGNALFYPHSLAVMAEGKNVFTVPLNPANPVLDITAFFLDLDDGPDNVFCGFDSRERDLPFHHLSAADWATYDETLEIDCTQETEATVVVRIRGVR